MGKASYQKWLERVAYDMDTAEAIEELSSQITADIAQDFVNFSKEKIKWLTLKMKL